MALPEVPIEVDSESGVWRTDGLPMLYMPRHFFINNHLAVEAALGRDAYAKMLYEPGYRSAFSWCGKEAETHGIGGFEVFRHYMRRLSQRGWGQFTVRRLDEATGLATVRVDHSTFVEAFRQAAAEQAMTGQAMTEQSTIELSYTEPPDGGGKARLCYMFAGWIPGALNWAGQNLGRGLDLIGEEVQCGAENGQAHCLFETRVTQP